MRDQGWRLGPHWYVPVETQAQPASAAGWSWAVVRRDGEGPRSLLQVWERPPDRFLDGLREAFLQRFSRAEAMDPGACHLGFDPDKAWFLQELGGIPLPRLWARADRAGRAALMARIGEAMAGSRAPRLLVPEVIGCDPGRVLAPRIFGAPGMDLDALAARLQREPMAEGPGDGERPWEEPPELADGSRLKLTGRQRELTYLKSLMLGLGAAIPMERVVILQGEEGLGHDRLCDWAAAAAESEGIRVADLDVYPGEAAGGLLERLVAELIAGLEAELYAACPDVARALSRRMATFAFLRGGRRGPCAPEAGPKEIAAALEALAFAQARHPRLVLIRGLERAAAGVPGLLRELILGSGLPWMLSARDPGLGPEGRACLAALAHHPASATLILDRLDDARIAEVLEDLLGAHDLPPAALARIGTASLGNPGLLQKILELAQAQGCILRQGGRWVPAAEGGQALELPRDLMADVLLGRLRRLRPAGLGAVNLLALADRGLAWATLGRAMGLDADAVEEALHPAQNAKLALVADGSARIAAPAVRDLAIGRMTPRELRAGAQALLRALGAEGGRPLLAVRLQAFALERGAALAKVLEGVEGECPGPAEAERIVAQALELGPDRLQEARLWEFQADAWERTGLEPSLEALARALGALGDGGAWPEDEAAARLQRKRGLLELRMGRLEASAAAFRRASGLLADHPFHPEQARLGLARGRLLLRRGEREPGLAALRGGLDLLARKAASGRGDQAGLLLELARAEGEGARFQGALAILEPVRRRAEHDRDRRLLAQALEAQGQVRLGMGHTEAAGACLREAMALARSLDDPTLVAECHLGLGITLGSMQLLGPSQASLDSALRRFDRLGDGPGAARALAWKARNLAALGQAGEAQRLLVRAAAAPEQPGPVERGERAFLDAESAGFQDDWSSARRHYQAAANRLAHAGLLWRERLARLRCIQAEAQERPATPEPAWIRLEQLKGPVEATGSRWLELEWRRAHALLLSAGDGGPSLAETLMAWGAVLAGARELRFPVLVLEAATRSSELLLRQGEKLGARTRIQDALSSAQELDAQLPEACRASFRGRSDLQRFRLAAENAGLDGAWPEPAEPMADWNPITLDLSLLPFFQADP